MPKLTFLLQKMLAHQELSKSEANEAMESILAGASAEQVAAFLTILRYRGEKSHEIIGILESIQRHSKAIQLPYPTLDIVGTGGDMANTVNISTGSALLAAACGIPMLKHGNRAVSSQCGSADVLTTLGVNIEIPPEVVPACVQASNIAFLYAPLYHPILKKIATFRRELGISTLFNLIGPLLNPAKAEHLLIGVAKEDYMTLMSDVILQLPHVKTAFVYYGNGLDELTTFGNATGYFIADGKKTKIEIHHNALGFKSCDLAQLRGGDANTNAKLLLNALSGKDGAITDALLLNAGVALTIYGKSASFAEGIECARQAIREGKALACLEKLVKFTNQFHKEKRRA